MKNCDSVAIEILKSLQGKLSSAHYSRKLGYKSNQVSRWSSGHSVFTWDDLCRVCEHHKIDFQAKLEKYTILNGDSKSFATLIKFYLPQHGVRSLANLANVSVSTMKRWLEGKNSPPANAVFSLVKSSHISFSKFVTSFFNDKKQMNRRISRLLAEENDLEEIWPVYPWADVLICLLPNPPYCYARDNLAEMISSEIDLDEAIVSDLLQRLERSGALKWSNTKEKFVVEAKKIQDVSGAEENLGICIKFWQRFHSIRTSSHDYRNKGLATFANIAVPESRARELEELYIKFLHQVISLSTPAPKVRTVNLFLALSKSLTPVLGQTHREFSKDPNKK